MTPLSWLGDLGRIVAFAALHLTSAALVAGSAWIFGESLLRRFRLAPREEGRWALATTLGLGLIAQALFVVGMLGLLDRAIVLILLALAHLPCHRVWRSLLERRQRRRLSPIELAGAATLALGAILALYPPTGFDATIYHLPYVEAFLEAERLVFVPELRFPVFPQVVEMGFVLSFCLSGEAPAQLTQVLSSLLTAGLIFAWGRRRFAPPVGLWAAALWLGTPLVVWVSAMAYVDVGLALFVTAAFYCWDRWRESGDRGWIWLAGCFAGLAAGTKYLGLFFCGVLGLWSAVGSWRQRSWRPLAALSIAMALTLGPWYLRIVYHTGNPVFPFYAPIFGESEWTSLHDQALAVEASWTAVAVRQSARVAEGLGFLLSVPWTAVFDREAFGFQAPLSPFYLVLIPLGVPLALGPPRSRRLLLLAGLYGLFWLTTVRDLRFLLPVMPMFHLALAAGLERLTRAMARPWLASGLAALFLASGLLYGGYKIYERGPLPVSGPERRDYVEARLPGFAAVRWLNETYGSSYTVYALYGERLRYYADGRFLGDRFGPMRYSKMKQALGEGPRLYEALRELGACYFLVRGDMAARMPKGAEISDRFERLPVDDSDFVIYRLLGPECSEPRAQRAN